MKVPPLLLRWYNAVGLVHIVSVILICVHHLCSFNALSFIVFPRRDEASYSKCERH